MKLIAHIFILPVILALAACGSGHNPADVAGDTITSRASLLTLVDNGSYMTATVADPWKEGRQLGRYYLVHRDSVLPDLPDDGVVIRVPVKKAAVFSSVHFAALDELGCDATVIAVADGQYFNNDKVKRGLQRGTIADVGVSTSPSIEKLIDLSPEVMLVSSFRDGDNSAVKKTGIGVIEMCDYMETTPLGRAEWILLLGALYDRLPQANDIYNNVSRKYQAMSDSVGDGEHGLVLTDLPTSGTWYCPAGGSYAARMIHDAGARVIFDNDTSAGSVAADIPKVSDLGAEADVWLIRSFGPLTRDAVQGISPLFGKMRPMVTDRVYVCDTSASTLFDDIAFHPERVLCEYINILKGSGQLNYFQKLK